MLLYLVQTRVAKAGVRFCRAFLLTACFGFLIAIIGK